MGKMLVGVLRRTIRNCAYRLRKNIGILQGFARQIMVRCIFLSPVIPITLALQILH
jgi:hypothetical protein